VAGKQRQGKGLFVDTFASRARERSAKSAISSENYNRNSVNLDGLAFAAGAGTADLALIRKDSSDKYSSVERLKTLPRAKTTVLQNQQPNAAGQLVRNSILASIPDSEFQAIALIRNLLLCRIVAFLNQAQASSTIAKSPLILSRPSARTRFHRS
jgi:hypothetical protein